MCEADLNFVLHTIWGHRFIRHAKKHLALSSTQYAVPVQTCNNAVLNKVLFCDLSHQTLTPGVLKDFDTTAVFDRVVAGMLITTCQRVGLPRIAGHFMFQLLHQMKFHLITGFGKSTISYMNDEDGITGQGVLQGSSSAAPIFILNSEISLTAYNKNSSGASFIHPIQGSTVTDNSVQYIDNTSQFLNTTNLLLQHPSPTNNASHDLIQVVSGNSQLWVDLMWMLGRNLNLGKCYYFAFHPVIDFKSNSMKYKKKFKLLWSFHSKPSRW